MNLKNFFSFSLIFFVSEVIFANQSRVLNLAQGFILSRLSFHGSLHVDADLSKSQKLEALGLHLKSVIGSLKDKKIALVDASLDPKKYLKGDLEDLLDSKDEITTIDFFFDELIVAPKKFEDHNSILIELISGHNLQDHQTALMACLPEFTVSLDLYWYYFQPSKQSCQEKISQDDHLSYLDQERPLFYTYEAKLDHKNNPQDSETPLVKIMKTIGKRKIIRIFLMTESEPIEFFDAQSAGLSFAIFLQKMLSEFPEMSQRFLNQEDDILFVDQSDLQVKAYDYWQLLSWIITDSNYPEHLNKKQKAKLRRQAMLRISNKLIEWEFSLNIGGQMVSVDLRTYHGDLYPLSANRSKVESLFANAYQEGDIVMHTGHSYHGNGLFDLSKYPKSSLRDKFQVLFWNGCYSLGFYFQSFSEPKRNSDLHLIANSLPSCVEGSGESLALGLIALLSGQTYFEALAQMDKVKTQSCFWNPGRVVLAQ